MTSGVHLHIVMLAETTQVAVKLFDAFLVGLYAFALEPLIELGQVRMAKLQYRNRIPRGTNEGGTQKRQIVDVSNMRVE